MAESIAPFFAARIVDERVRVEVPFYFVNTSDHESLLESVEAIKLSHKTAEQISGMLAVVKAKAADMFSEDERASLFKDVAESDGTPYTFKLEAQGNHTLLYEALDQMTAQVKTPEAPAKEDTAVSDLKKQVAELTEELDCINCITEAVVPFQNLPLASEDTTWDAGEARKALKEWASDKEGEVNWNKYRKGFCWYDSAESDKASAYKFPIATVESDKLVAVPAAISAAAGRLESSNISDPDKNDIKNHLEKYYKKMDKDAPWSKKEDVQPSDNKVVELETKVSELTEANATLSSTIETLRAEMVEFQVLKHDSVVKEAARLAIDLERAFTKDKSFEDVCNALTVRTDESLEDMISDCKLEVIPGKKAEEAASEEPESSGEVTEQVEDPTLQNTKGVAELDPKKDLEGVKDALYETITTDPKDVEAYRLVLSEDEINDIFGDTSIKESQD